MPDNVSFNEIPVDIRTPGQYIEIDNSLAVQGLPGMPRKVLVLGQRLTGGSVEAETPAQVLGREQGEAFFGRGSQIAGMLKALRAVNRTSEVWAVALDDDAAAAPATGQIAVTGTATATGTLALYIAGHRVRVGVTAADQQDAIAQAVVDAINAQTDLPVTAAINGTTANQVDITARNAGEAGNDIDIRANYYQGESLPAGVTLTITDMASGTANPDIALALAAIGDSQYYTIVSGWTDDANMTALETELQDRWGPLEQKTGHVFTGLAGTHAELGTWSDNRNSPHVTTMGVHDSPTPPWVWAAAVAGVVEYHGAIDPARPFQTLAIDGLLPPPPASRFTREERDLLLHDGIATFTVDDGGRVLIERIITNYQTNAAGIEDISYLDLNTKWTVDYVRYATRARIAMRYPRHKLADDGTAFAPGQAVVTPKVIRAELLSLFRDLEEAGLVENFDQFKEDLLVVRSSSDPNRINTVMPPDLINQFRVFAAAVQFRL